MRDMETQKSIVVSVASGVIRFILAQLPQTSVWDLRTTGKPTRMSGRFLCLSETKQEIIELFRMHTDDNCYFEKLTHFFLATYRSTTAFKQSCLMPSKEILSVAEIGLIFDSLRDVALVLLFLTREKNCFPPQEDV